MTRYEVFTLAQRAKHYRDMLTLTRDDNAAKAYPYGCDVNLMLASSRQQQLRDQKSIQNAQFFDSLHQQKYSCIDPNHSQYIKPTPPNLLYYDLGMYTGNGNNANATYYNNPQQHPSLVASAIVKNPNNTLYHAPGDQKPMLNYMRLPGPQ